MNLFDNKLPESSSHSWLWNMDTEEVKATRRELQRWFDQSTDERWKNGIKQKMGKGRGDFYGAFFELYMHEWLVNMGFHPIPYDTRPGKTPDFLVRDRNGTDLFFLECTAICSSEDELRHNNWVDQISDVIHKALPGTIDAFRQAN